MKGRPLEKTKMSEKEKKYLHNLILRLKRLYHRLEKLNN